MPVDFPGMGGTRARHHRMQLGTGEADVAKQVVIELEQVGEGLALRRAAEKRREIESHFQGPLQYWRHRRLEDGPYATAMMNGL